MSINVSNLILQLQQKISNTDNENSLLHYAKALQALRSGTINTVGTVAELPTASENLGKLFLVVGDSQIYWSAGETGVWISLADSYPKLLSWGNNTDGSLGDGSIDAKCVPTQEVSLSSDWCHVTAGSNFSGAIKTNGTLWAWGRGICGALGDGTVVNKCSPVQEISASSTWCYVAAERHQAALKTDGTLWLWGANGCGRLGDGTVVDKCSPVQEISASTNWCQVSTGSVITPAVKTDGTLWLWGRGLHGVLGDGTVVDKCSPIQEISSSTNWCQSASCSHVSALKTDGTLWSWGRNLHAQLGDGTVVDKCSPVQEISASTNWCKVSAGGYVNSAIKTDGTLWSWGQGLCGALGTGFTTGACSPVQEISLSTNWCQVDNGYRSSAGIKTDGTLWSWGNGQCGRMGDGTVTSKCSPVQEICSLNVWTKVSVGFCRTAAIAFVET
jgi:alpha-tubulin suppressor-like RCC1 family protein